MYRSALYGADMYRRSKVSDEERTMRAKAEELQAQARATWASLRTYMREVRGRNAAAAGAGAPGEGKQRPHYHASHHQSLCHRHLMLVCLIASLLDLRFLKLAGSLMGVKLRSTGCVVACHPM